MAVDDEGPACSIDGGGMIGLSRCSTKLGELIIMIAGMWSNGLECKLCPQ